MLKLTSISPREATSASCPCLQRVGEGADRAFSCSSRDFLICVPCGSLAGLRHIAQCVKFWLSCTVTTSNSRTFHHPMNYDVLPQPSQKKKFFSSRFSNRNLGAANKFACCPSTPAFFFFSFEGAAPSKDQALPYNRALNAAGHQ